MKLKENIFVEKWLKRKEKIHKIIVSKVIENYICIEKICKILREVQIDKKVPKK